MSFSSILLNGRKVALEVSHSEVFKTEELLPLKWDAIRRKLLESGAEQRDRLVDITVAETGYSRVDSEEMVEGLLAFLEKFEPANYGSCTIRGALPDRSLTVSSQPIGTILGICPQNAFAYLATVVALNGIAAGNRVVLRSSNRTPSIAEWLANLFEGIEGISIISGSAEDLLHAFCKSEGGGLFHYFGSSGRLPSLSKQCAKHGKIFLGDGEGNTWAFVDQSADPARAASLLVAGAVRYNGETCTSVNGAIIHPDLYEEVKSHVLRLSPKSDYTLKHESQIKMISKSRGHVLRDQGLVLIDRPRSDSRLVRQGIFGAALWLMPGDEALLRAMWLKNEYPLCFAFFGSTGGERFCNLPNLARLVINGDPSIEDPLEPWGGYGRSGTSRVEEWHYKYRRPLQIDSPHPLNDAK